MASFLFSRILEDAARKSIFPNKTMLARKWFRDTAFKTRVSPQLLVEKNPTKLHRHVAIGQMFCFFYDPKWKKELPYYDRFPLIFPIEKKDGKILGINMHYLPYTLRAKLMDGLYEHVSNKKYDVTTKIRLSYKILKGTTRLKLFKPCIKMYLPNHVRSMFLKIEPRDWDTALFLPVERFQKATKEQVWKDSKKIVGR